MTANPIRDCSEDDLCLEGCLADQGIRGSRIYNNACPIHAVLLRFRLLLLCICNYVCTYLSIVSLLLYVALDTYLGEWLSLIIVASERHPVINCSSAACGVRCTRWTVGLHYCSLAASILVSMKHRSSVGPFVCLSSHNSGTYWNQGQHPM